MVELTQARAVAAFVSPLWKDQSALRLWAKLLGAKVATEIVLITDDASEGNVVLARQLRCSGIVCAVVRLPTVLRSQEALDKARHQRDSAMAMVVDAVWDFGGVFAGISHKPVTVAPLAPV